MAKLINVVGARPNFMKIAPIVSEIERRSGLEQVLVHTGQHYDNNLSRVFFDELSIPRPDVNLEVGSGDRDSQIKAIMERFAPVVDKECPEIVVVVGDVNSTIACARVAKSHGVAVAHVEAGLRSFDPSMPEEHNRRETDEVADYLFVTEQSGMENLKAEKVPGKSYLVGNVMIDTLVRSLKRVAEAPLPAGLEFGNSEYSVGTFHRPSNVDSEKALGRLLDALTVVTERVPMVLPLHPRTRHALERTGLDQRLKHLRGLRLVEPLGYLPFLRLLRDAKAVVTDSGGIQEETTYLGVPCLTMRENTERPVTISLGSNVLVGWDIDRLGLELDSILQGRFKRCAVPPLWDGKAAERIVAILAEESGA